MDVGRQLCVVSDQYQTAYIGVARFDGLNLATNDTCAKRFVCPCDVFDEGRFVYTIPGKNDRTTKVHSFAASA